MIIGGSSTIFRPIDLKERESAMLILVIRVNNGVFHVLDFDLVDFVILLGYLLV